MELHRYWNVLARRKRVVINTFFIVALLALVTVAYSYLNSQYEGRAVLGIRLQPQVSRNAVVDPETAAIGNTKSVVLDLATYASEQDYFQRMTYELSRPPFNVKTTWQSLSSSLLIKSTEQQIFFTVYGSNQLTVQKIVTVAVDQIEAEIPRYHAAILSTAPPIRAVALTNPSATHVSLSKPAIDFGLRALLGLLAGIILAYLFEYLDSSIQDSEDIQEFMGVSLLGRVPAKVASSRSA